MTDNLTDTPGIMLGRSWDSRRVAIGRRLDEL